MSKFIYYPPFKEVKFAYHALMITSIKQLLVSCDNISNCLSHSQHFIWIKPALCDPISMFPLKVTRDNFDYFVYFTFVIRIGAFLPGTKAVVMTISTSLHCLAYRAIWASLNSCDISLISLAYPPSPAPDSWKFKI